MEADHVNELRLPQSPDELAKRLKFLHEERRKFPPPPRPRASLTRKQRAIVLRKTDGHCHLCGGDVKESNSGGETTESTFVADHVLAYAAGGQHSIDNYFAAHGLCNGCRWSYSPRGISMDFANGDLGAQADGRREDRHRCRNARTILGKRESCEKAP
jgi:hypothetical protein